MDKKESTPQNNKTNTVVIAVLGVIVLVLTVTQLFEFDLKPGPLARRLFNSEQSAKPTPSPEQKDFNYYLAQVAPSQGFTVNIKWGDIGKKLVSSGAIDLTKFKKNYTDPRYKEVLTYLTETKDEPITINSKNAYFWVNTLWALGLTQKSDVLEKGVMNTEYKKDLGNFASTGGWTLGAKKATQLYNSAQIVSLTPEQQDLVRRVASNIYRPCCGNPTSFPDCNHGMAILGLLEIMASQGATESDMYKAALAFNSYWFTGTYADLAYYYDTKLGKEWSEVDPKEVLGANYSSALGYQKIKKEIGTIPGAKSQGGSCGA